MAKRREEASQGREKRRGGTRQVDGGRWTDVEGDSQRQPASQGRSQRAPGRKNGEWVIEFSPPLKLS